jgi:hypothetical protein
MTFMQANGYQDYSYQHALLWKSKKTNIGLGPQVIKTWWYDNWLNEVQEYCGKAETHINKLSPTKVLPYFGP